MRGYRYSFRVKLRARLRRWGRMGEGKGSDNQEKRVVTGGGKGESERRGASFVYYLYGYIA